MYKGIFKNDGIIVGAEKAFNYAIQRVVQGTKEEKKEFIEWYYSGDWVEEEDKI